MSTKPKFRWHGLWPLVPGVLGIVLFFGAFTEGADAVVNIFIAALLFAVAYLLDRRARRIDAAWERQDNVPDLDAWLNESLTGPVAVITLTPSTPGPALVYPAAHERGYDLVSETSERTPTGNVITATLRRREA